MPRRVAFVFSPVLAAAVLFACEDDSGSSSGGAFAFDGGGFDGATAPRPDAPIGDAPAADADGAADADVPLPVTVSVLKSDGTPEPGVNVVLSDAKGDVLYTAPTGANGKLVSVGLTPSIVSVLLGNGRTKHVLTWAAVQAGDVLVARDLDPESATGAYTVTFPAPTGTVDEYRVSVGDCTGYLFASAPAPITFTPRPSCLRPGNTNPILARARMNGTDQFFSFAKGQPAPAPDAGTANVALAAWAGFGTVALTPANKPSSPAIHGRLDEVVGTTIYASDIVPIDATGAATFRVATGFADALQVSSRAVVGTGSSYLTTVKRTAPAATASVDFAPSLPIISGATLDRTEFKRPKIAWVSASPLTAADGGSIVITWSKPNEDARGWTFIVPPGATNVRAPALPTVADDWTPPSPVGGGFSSQVSEPSVVFVDASTITSEAAFRGQAGILLPAIDRFDRLRGAALAANGDTLRATEYRLTVTD